MHKTAKMCANGRVKMQFATFISTDSDLADAVANNASLTGFELINAIELAGH